ncbi:MAG: methionyl-tRNA formyltransferase [Rikenellaceae bacterium]
MDAKQLRIVYMGTPEFAVASLRALVEGGYNVVGVVTMPDKPAGRGLKLQQSAVKQYALEKGLFVMQPEKLKAEEFVEQFRTLEVDLGIVIAFRMLPEIIWSMPKFGTFNLHASLLPAYRGAAPINHAIINGETLTGVTTFMLNSRIDEGDILLQSSVEITEADNVGTLHDKLMNLGEDLVVKTVEKIASGLALTVAQKDVAVSENIVYEASKIFKNDCHLDFSWELKNIHNKVRGLSPFPSAWSSDEGSESTVKIFETSTEFCEHDLAFGEVVSDDKTYMKVACKGGFLHIHQMQISGKKRMSVADFLRGSKSFAKLV